MASYFPLTTLLVFLLTYTFFLYPLEQVSSVKFLTFVFLSLILISGAIAASRNRILKTLVFSWGLFTLVFLWVRYRKSLIDKLSDFLYKNVKFLVEGGECDGA